MKCYDNIVLAGDLNIDLLDPSKDTLNHLSDLLDVFNLKNLVKEPTCFMSHKGSLIDLILTNKHRSFHKTQGFVTDISYLDSRLIQGELYNNYREPYGKLKQIFSEAPDYHASVKQKVARGNQAPFMTKDLSKAITMKSKAKNQYVKWGHL